MRLAYVSAPYRAYVPEFYARRPGLELESFEAQRAAFEHEAFGWAGAWGPALAPLGGEVLEVWLGVEPMLRAWAREHPVPGANASLEDIAVARVRAFAPDVLWYDHHDARLFERLCACGDSIRLTLGWVGSWLPDVPLWSRFDRVLSCAPESIESLNLRGASAELLPHAFNERVLERLSTGNDSIDLSFLGQITIAAPSHVHRARVLERLVREPGIEIFSPGGEVPGPGGILLRRAVWNGMNALRAAGVPEDLLRRAPFVGRARTWPDAPHSGASRTLRRAMRPGRFGLDMYRTLRDSRVTLNVQASSATRFTSNMRLFEATGVGTCLLTDAAENLPSLFEPEREVATYSNDEECVERARWLLEHDAERAAIAKAGQARCLSAHTFHHRAPRLLEIIRGALG